jgi:archaemetzincin
MADLSIRSIFGKHPTTEVIRQLADNLPTVMGPAVYDISVSHDLAVAECAYNLDRDQYEAGILLSVLRSVSEPCAKRSLAVTDVDLYSPPLNFVFGQADCPGRFAVLSIHRLRPGFYGKEADAELLLDRSLKEAVHEVAHTFGLRHCTRPTCVMSFSNSILDVDRKTVNFCSRCLAELAERS